MTIGQLLAGQRDYYEPVTYGPVSIPVTPADAASTTYAATALGLGAVTTPEALDQLSAVQYRGWLEVVVYALPSTSSPRSSLESPFRC
ncbi:MAG: hypothetical protein QM758_29065 [Armatimonas sp.]